MKQNLYNTYIPTNSTLPHRRAISSHYQVMNISPIQIEFATQYTQAQSQKLQQLDSDQHNKFPQQKPSQISIIHTHLLVQE